jgi:hypothetical protein
MPTESTGKTQYPRIDLPGGMRAEVVGAANLKELLSLRQNCGSCGAPGPDPDDLYTRICSHCNTPFPAFAIAEKPPTNTNDKPRIEMPENIDLDSNRYQACLALEKIGQAIIANDPDHLNGLVVGYKLVEGEYPIKSMAYCYLARYIPDGNILIEKIREKIHRRRKRVLVSVKDPDFYGTKLVECAVVDPKLHSSGVREFIVNEIGRLGEKIQSKKNVNIFNDNNPGKLIIT